MASTPTTIGTEMPASRRGEPTWEMALFFPTQGSWTEADYLELDAKSNRLIELSDGCLEVLPMPTFVHQFIVQYLFKRFDGFVLGHQLGRVLFAPLPIRAGSGKYREPDIAYFRQARIGDLRKPPDGADLALEVVSEGEKSRKRDLETKREEYALAGITEYWIVDPQEGRITVLTLDGNAYKVHGEFTGEQNATSVLLAGFSVSVDATFAAGEGK